MLGFHVPLSLRALAERTEKLLGHYCLVCNITVSTPACPRRSADRVQRLTRCYVLHAWLCMWWRWWASALVWTSLNREHVLVLPATLCVWTWGVTFQLLRRSYMGNGVAIVIISTGVCTTLVSRALYFYSLQQCSWKPVNGASENRSLQWFCHMSVCWNFDFNWGLIK